MKIKLNEIKPSTPRVRESQSPEKLDELAQSIKESGVIVPVKVRKNGDGYTLVYGHRRVAAAKMAGLTEIDAIVEDMTDDVLLEQALIENVVREDMPSIEIAKALQKIKDESGATNEAIAAKMGWGGGESVRRYFVLLDPELGIEKNEHARFFEPDTIKQALAGTGGDKKLTARVIKKSFEGDEPLSRKQTRQVAEIVRQASEFGGQRAVDAVLKKRADEILRAARPVEEYKKHKSPVRMTKVEGEVLFQWIKDTRVILAEEGLRAVSACVAAINQSEADRGGGKAVLKNLKERTEVVLNQIDEVLRGYGK